MGFSGYAKAVCLHCLEMSLPSKHHGKEKHAEALDKYRDGFSGSFRELIHEKGNADVGSSFESHRGAQKG